MTQNERVLQHMKAFRKLGTTALDYPVGFPIRSRIADLRRKGYNIRSQRDTSTPLTRYFLEDE